MSTFWSEEKIAMYEDACHMLDYPEIPLGPYFKKIIRPDDTVMDIGCGPGVVTLYLASLCQSVTAVDPDDAAIENLKKAAADKGICHIDIVHSKWPDPTLAPCDVTVLLYVFKALDSIDRIRDLLHVTKRAGIILEPVTKKGFYDSLYSYLGVEVKDTADTNGRRTIELLQSQGATVQCEEITHDFGQPVDSLDEAAQFIWQKLHISEDYYPKVRGVVEDYTEMRKGRLYVPNKRVNRLITFEK